MTDSTQFTQILEAHSNGDAAASARLLELVYHELRARAARLMIHQSPAHTLQPTALVHEAFLRLAGKHEVDWRSRAHFVAVAATAMRQILINHARDRAAGKRGGGWERITLEAAMTPWREKPLDLLDLDDALTRLSALSERQGRVIELRFFGGLSIAEVSHILEVSTTTVENDWAMARAWLLRELNRDR
ncbi:MAG: ECF-type sigma factor [Planctomycetota bacterium]